MTEWQDDAILIRMGHFNESNVWASLLFRDHGLLTVFAFGALRSKRRFCGCLDIFNSLSCHVKASGNGHYLVLQEASLLEGPVNLRVNWRRMSLAANCLLFLRPLEINPESSPECFALLDNLRFFLETAQLVTMSVPFNFRLRLASALGIAPEFGICGHCGQKLQQDALFLPSEGRVFCEHCAHGLPPPHKRSVIRLPSWGIEHLEKVKTLLPQEWHDEKLCRNERQLCCQAINAFISYHFDAERDKNNFYG